MDAAKVQHELSTRLGKEFNVIYCYSDEYKAWFMKITRGDFEWTGLSAPLDNMRKIDAYVDNARYMYKKKQGIAA
jgi:hypothetical protein